MNFIQHQIPKHRQKQLVQLQSVVFKISNIQPAVRHRLILHYTVGLSTKPMYDDTASL